MRSVAVRRYGWSCWLAVLLVGAGLTGVVFQLEAQTGQVASASVSCFPANGAKGVNPDTHLVLTFASAAVIGKTGWIRVYDAAGHRLVDSIDMSVPAGPDPLHRVAPAETIPL